MRVLLLCLLLGGCAHVGGKYSADKGPLKNDFEATALVLRWGYKNNINLGEVIRYRPGQDAVYLVFRNPEGRRFSFKVQRNPKKAELLSEADKNVVPLATR